MKNTEIKKKNIRNYYYAILTFIAGENVSIFSDTLCTFLLCFFFFFIHIIRSSLVFYFLFFVCAAKNKHETLSVAVLSVPKAVDNLMELILIYTFK